jgi:hypothetical protein
VLRCLAKSPDDRFQTMLELQSACDALLARLSVGGGVPALGTLGARSSAGSVIPARDSLPFTAPSHPTTLSSAAGVTQPSLPGQTRRTGVWIGIAAASIGAGIAAAIALAGGGVPAPDRGSAAVAAPAPPPVTILPAVAPRPAPPAVLDARIDETQRADAPPAAAPAPAAQPAAPVAQPPAPASKSRSRPKPHRPAPERPEELYDDR